MTPLEMVFCSSGVSSAYALTSCMPAGEAPSAVLAASAAASAPPRALQQLWRRGKRLLGRRRKGGALGPLAGGAPGCGGHSGRRDLLESLQSGQRHGRRRLRGGGRRGPAPHSGTVRVPCEAPAPPPSRSRRQWRRMRAVKGQVQKGLPPQTWHGRP